jgi:hypothetical protein
VKKETLGKNAQTESVSNVLNVAWNAVSQVAELTPRRNALKHALKETFGNNSISPFFLSNV